MALRDVHWTDLARLAELETELFGADAWSEASWWSELAGRPRRDYVIAVATHDGHGQDRQAEVAPSGGPPDEGSRGVDAPTAGEVLGYAGLDHGGEVADVMTIAVAPAGRRRGLGTRLLTELVDRARARRAEHLLLEVRADNDAARALYARAGFETISVRRGYYRPGPVDAHVMRLTLERSRQGETP